MKDRRQIFLYILTVAVLLFGLTAPGFSWYVGNYSEKGFDEPGEQTSGTSSTMSSATIKDLITKSATYFFKGKSDIDLLVSKLEAAEQEGVWFYELQTIVNGALENMRTSRYYYQTLMNRAENTPYNQGVINQLASFSYDSFAGKNSLNRDMFDQVKGYLQAGNVRGTYTRLYTYTDTIIGMLETVQSKVYYWELPEISSIWKLNQECAHMLLFGQYMAQIFYEL